MANQGEDRGRRKRDKIRNFLGGFLTPSRGRPEDSEDPLASRNRRSTFTRTLSKSLRERVHSNKLNISSGLGSLQTNNNSHSPRALASEYYADGSHSPIQPSSIEATSMGKLVPAIGHGTPGTDANKEAASASNWCPSWIRLRSSSEARQAQGTSNSKQFAIEYAIPATSFVIFVLETVEKLGEGLPGVGAVGVVLSILKNIKSVVEGNEDVKEALEYVEGVLEDVESSAVALDEIAVSPSDCADFIE
ncbi:hypothetical protein SCHPADRAFT_127980 [Schizopora paradoxa]|uniref:Uncharacterized protein n=1 Tax=Schizopora paradoxa TaxID=27342 RepID=A0A0H2S2Z0_9AGAM|nr:hypothetical protein SCHPADRAFT_127980 [Schizopora paradoxa]